MAAEPPPGARKGFALPGNPTVWIIGLVVALGAGAWLLYRRSQSGTASSSAGAGTAADSGTADDAGQLGTLQTEIGDLQSTEGKVTVPQTVGLTQAEAFGVISSVGLKPAGSPGVAGQTLTVDSSSPAAGAALERGSTVTLRSTVHKKPGPAPKPKPKPKPVPKRDPDFQPGKVAA